MILLNKQLWDVPLNEAGVHRDQVRDQVDTTVYWQVDVQVTRMVEWQIEW